MAWLLEGATQSPAPTLESGTTWTFSWPITGVSDGTYTVGVQAINAEGVKGPPVSIPVILIRNVPIAPKVAAGGFNTVEAKHKATKVVELEWTANSERNVIGYRVYNPSKELVCPGSLIILSTATTCIDLNAPAMGAANLTYEVVALYYAAEGELLSKTVSQGKVATFAPERTEEAPKSPRELKLVTSEGNVTLSWQPPEAGGAAVSFYRIYRGSTEYSSRIAATTSTTYTDPNPETSHEYWVTAVSSKLAESKPIGPVFG
jgi:hypothetical protein